METRTRTIVKATTWQISGLASMSGLAWLQTGSISGAFSLALSAAAIGFVCFFLHERIWAGVSWGRRSYAEGTRVTAATGSNAGS